MIEGEGRGGAGRRWRWPELVAGLLLASALLGGPLFLLTQRSAQAVPPSGEARLVAQRFEDGGWTPAVVRVKAGQRIALHLTSRDVTHGFLVPALGLRAGPLVAGQETILELPPLPPGIYPFYCNVYCSHRHGAMVGQIVVE